VSRSLTDGALRMTARHMHDAWRLQTSIYDRLYIYYDVDDIHDVYDCVLRFEGYATFSAVPRVREDIHSTVH